MAEDAEEEEVGTLITADGTFFSRFETRRNYSPGDLDASDFFRYRARVGLTLTPPSFSDVIAVSARFAPQAGGFMHVGGDTLGDVELGLHEGFAMVHHDNFRVDLGRFEMNYGEQLMIGAVGWHHFGRAFDGARFHWAPADAGYFCDVFFTVLSEGVVSDLGDPFGAGDQYFAGLYTGFGGLISDSMDLDLYVLTRTLPTTDALELEGATQVTVGARNKGSAGAFFWRFEGGAQFGSRPTATPGPDATNPSVSAFQGDLELGVAPGEGDLRLSLEGFFASGDDPTTDDAEGWDHHFPTAHKWLGLMDFVGPRSNITGGAVHALYKAGSHWRFRLDAHAFNRNEVPDGVDGFLGTEIDLNIIYVLGGGFRTRLGYDIFLLNEPADADPLHMVELEARLDF